MRARMCACVCICVCECKHVRMRAHMYTACVYQESYTSFFRSKKKTEEKDFRRKVQLTNRQIMRYRDDES